MKIFDYIIIGFGIAGVSMFRELTLRNQRCLVIDAENQTATRVAGGTLHAAVLGQYRKVWEGEIFWHYAENWYNELERDLNITLNQRKGLIKRFNSDQDRKTWTAMRNSDDQFWSEYLNPVSDQINGVSNLNLPYGYGTSNQFCRFDPVKLLNKYANHLKVRNQYLLASIQASSAVQLYNSIRSLDVSAKTIILAQGHQQEIWPNCTLGNPIQPKQGEYVIIDCPSLDLRRVLKSKFFIIPLGGDRYQIGATYMQKIHETTVEEAKMKLFRDIDAVIKLPYKVIEYCKGIRPGTKDRKPILGAIDDQRSIFMINGLNSRGLLMAPMLSSWLADHILNETPIPKEVSINRFFLPFSDRS